MRRERRVTDRTSIRRLAEITGTLNVATPLTHSFRREHLFSACYLLETGRQLESLGVAAVGAEGLARHRACMIGAIFLSVAFLESAINELYLELQDAGRNGISAIPKRAHALLARLWPSVEFSPMMLRYRVALQAADAERFNEARAPYRDVANLLRLRDALVHHRPERYDERRRHHSLQLRLRGEFPANTLLPARARWFPDVCLGSGCAAWAIRTAEAFSDAFCGRMSIPSRGRASHGTTTAPANPRNRGEARQGLVPSI